MNRAIISRCFPDIHGNSFLIKLVLSLLSFFYSFSLAKSHYVCFEIIQDATCVCYSAKMEVVQNIKCVIVGKKLVGKTSLLNSFVTSPYSEVAPFESLNGIKVQIEEEDEIFQLELWDTNSDDHQKMIRNIYYTNCSMMLVCYSVMDHESFKDAKNKVNLPKICSKIKS